MQLVREIGEAASVCGGFVSIGNFDGVHAVGHWGHQEGAERLSLFAPKDRCSLLDRSDWLYVSGFAIQDSRQHVSDRLFIGVGVLG